MTGRGAGMGRGARMGRGAGMGRGGNVDGKGTRNRKGRDVAQGDKSSTKVEKKWSTLEPALERTYFGFPPLRTHLIGLAFGDEVARAYADDPRWAENIVIDRHLGGREVRSVLSLCCGFGLVEQHFAHRLPQARFLGLDLAAGALEVARQRAAAAGLADRITYERADLNDHDFGEARHDLIIANGALHHLSRLEDVLAKARAALRPGGMLYANETVGPSHQDFPPRQLELINAAAYLVPPELRGRIGAATRATPVGKALHAGMALATGRLYLDAGLYQGRRRQVAQLANALFPSTRRRSFVFEPLRRSQKAQLLRTDPSEGVRSAEIVPVMRQVFGEVEVHPYGGGILTYALDDGFYRGYDPESAAHRELLALLCRIESTFMRTGELPTEHAMLMAWA